MLNFDILVWIDGTSNLFYNNRSTPWHSCFIRNHVHYNIGGNMEFIRQIINSFWTDFSEVVHFNLDYLRYHRGKYGGRL